MQARHYRDSLLKLRRAVQAWNDAGVEMVLDLGDILDGGSRRRGVSLREMDVLEKEISRLKAPYYHLLGNHDLSNFDFDAWRELRTLYSFRKWMPKETFRLSLLPFPKWRFLLLDSFEIGVVGHESADHKEDALNDSALKDAAHRVAAHKDATHKEAVHNGSHAAISQEAWRLLRQRNKNENANSASGLGEGSAARRWVAYNAALGKDQLRWLEAELERAQKAGEKVVVFTHIPLHPQVEPEHYGRKWERTQTK